MSEAISRAFVMATDRRWFDTLGAMAGANESLDNVNFWRPSAQDRFHAVPRGGQIFFRLKSPVNRIVGFGTFVTELHERISVAWDLFGDKNGYPDLEAFTSAIVGYRHRPDRPDGEALGIPLTCLVLVDAVFLPPQKWLPWGEAEEWQRNVVVGKGYDLTRGPGLGLQGLRAEWLGSRSRRAAELSEEYASSTFVPVSDDQRTKIEIPITARPGQPAFKASLIGAYGACAVTREHSRPVLDAAHIQPYRGPQSDHPQNGLLLRTDLHRLFDGGYVTVTPDGRFEVSRRLREEFDNGKAYYEFHGRQILVPDDASARPSPAALAWHNENVFR